MATMLNGTGFISLHWSPGLCGLLHSPTIPPSLSMHECGAEGSASHLLVGSASCSLACPALQCATSLGQPAASLLWVLTPLLLAGSPHGPPPLPRCPSPPLLLVWMNVSSLSPWLSWLSEFYTLQFSVSSGCFFVFKLLLSFFWLCEEAQCVYLGLHLGQKLWNKNPVFFHPWLWFFFRSSPKCEEQCWCSQLATIIAEWR